MSWGLTIPLILIYSDPSVNLNFFWPLISKFPLGKTLTTVTDRYPVRELDWAAEPAPLNEFVLEALPPSPAKFLKRPVGPTSAPIESALLDEAVTDFEDENVSFNVTVKISPTLWALLSEEKSPAELPL